MSLRSRLKALEEKMNIDDDASYVVTLKWLYENTSNIESTEKVVLVHQKGKPTKVLTMEQFEILDPDISKVLTIGLEFH